MLGYDAHVHEISAGVSAEDLHRITQVPYEDRTTYLAALTSRPVAYIPYRTWVDHLLKSSEEGRAQLLHDGGYPYIFYATGADIKANFAGSGSAAIAALTHATWYLVEAWDQS